MTSNVCICDNPRITIGLLPLLLLLLQPKAAPTCKILQNSVQGPNFEENFSLFNAWWWHVEKDGSINHLIKFGKYAVA